MKASELMIGDWVIATCKENIPPVDVFDMLPRAGRVVGIEADCIYLDFCDFGFMPQDLDPVTLTPEILEENFRGYKRGSGALTYFVYELNEEYFIRASARSVDFCTHYDDSEHAAHDDIYLVELRYVHTLQHVLPLYGIDKEITI